MKGIKLLIFFTVILLLGACRSDEFSEDLNTNPIPTDIPTSITGNLNGLVVDENQQAISGALIVLDGITTSTDENGVFSFDNAVALSTGSLVNINKDGYYDGFKFTRFEPGQNSILKVQMVSKKIISSFQNTEEASIDVNGARLDLPGDITIRADGSPYNGLVNVKAFWYDPTDENTITNMPGDLRGIDVDGLTRQLTTYGMMAVELSDDTGEELILKEGMTATLTFPLPQNANGPNEIPMWHLDETSGVWIEEGKATRMGSAMVAEVSHFSFWNCDASFEVVNLKGRIISNPGEQPLSGLQVMIADIDQMISGYGYTNNEGIFSGAVPLGIDLTMSIFRCGELLSISDIGLLTQDTDLGNIILEIDGQLNLKASLVDCAGAALEKGIALITTDNSVDLVVANNGQINHTLFPCNGGDGTFLAYLSISEVSEEIAFDLQDSFVDLRAVTVCDVVLTEGEIAFSVIGGPPVRLAGAIVSIVDDTYLHIYAEEAGSSPVKFIELRYYLDGVPQLMGQQNQISYSAGIFPRVTHNDPDGIWNQVSGLEVGDSVSGFLEDFFTIETLVYNLKINQIVKTSTVTGHVWVDTDEDGIREVGENDSLPDDLKIFVWSVVEPGDEIRYGFRLYYEFFQLNSDGTYSCKGLAPNKKYALGLDNDDIQVTSYQQGDETIDNDFIKDIVTGGAAWAIDKATAIFTLDTEEIRPNMGLGIITQ